MIIGYLRVSTNKQNHARQVRGMKELCDRLYVETGSAAADKRPVFETVLTRLKRGDTLLVWDMDRAFRSTEDAIVQARVLEARGVAFQAVNFVIDTGTADGNYAYQMNAAAAERERRKISERTKQGLAAARARGARLGRPPKMTAKQIASARAAYDAGRATLAELAARYGVHPSTIARTLQRHAEPEIV